MGLCYRPSGDLKTKSKLTFTDSVSFIDIIIKKEEKSKVFTLAGADEGNLFLCRRMK